MRLAMTRQITECILIDGQRRQLMSVPLEVLCDRAMSSIIGREEGTHCYRGYVGVWAIRNGALILDEVCDPSCIEDGDQLSEIGLRRYPADEIDHILRGRELPVHARWFSGHLKLPYGPELIGRMGWGSIYQYFRVLSIEKGIVRRDRFVDSHAIVERYFRQNAGEREHGFPDAASHLAGTIAWFDADADHDEGVYDEPIKGFESAYIVRRS